MGKIVNGLIIIISIVGILGLAFCLDRGRQAGVFESPDQKVGQIYLYGETHGDQKILDKEFELWNEYYHTEGMRHLFIEYPYYTAEFLNRWMQSDNDEILNEIYADLEGTKAQAPQCKAFYKKIKAKCPETIFHGTDVGHQYNTTGTRFLAYLKENGLENSSQYALTMEAIEQGKLYDRKSDDVYRENKMVENFTREFNDLKGENIMGIYGSAHTDIEGMDFITKSIPCMANQLKEVYGDLLHSENLSIWAKDIGPYRVDRMSIAGKDYKALYFGKEEFTGGNSDLTYREYWRLEEAYMDFKDMPKKQDVLPYKHFPMLIEEGQVFVIDEVKKDGAVTRRYAISNGRIWKGQLVAEEILVEK